MNDSEPDSYDKKWHVKESECFGKVAQGNAREISKTASYSEPIQILTLVPDKWSRMYCSECFNILEYLVLTSREIKKVGEILAEPAPEKGKAIITETLHLVINVFEDDNFSRWVLEKKDCVSVSKGVHKQKLELAKVFVTSKNFTLLSKKNNQM